ncbi:hypothetical protein [Amycolatopsis sp. SID8362]|uniref:hypothetical protein n=1 Tax=Amycolatopsis sp. SID8362 TaxID=2690346 RepID=UPI00136CC83F|nr:hypothetical protein [Amycolatopsis sp. SID8362]NBH03513.1 hypothetical protein [Amycolatopsis sp. SID8362]NED40213.1 hypothetical protein [Amycolatopsis sp. SID8362]
MTAFAAERGRTVKLYILAETDIARRPWTSVPRGMSLTVSALVPGRRSAASPFAADHPPPPHVLAAGQAVPNLRLGPCRHDHRHWLPFDGEPIAQSHVLGRSGALPNQLWMCERGTEPCSSAGHHCEGLLGRLTDCDVHLVLCAERDTEIPGRLRGAGSGGDGAESDVAARRRCVEEAVRHRRRLRGMTGDLEFLRYLSALPEHERAWVAESSAELRRAGGDQDTIERRLSEKFRKLDNGARHEHWRGLEVDDQVTLLRHSAHMRSWVTRELVELNDFLHVARSANTTNEVAAHLLELDQLTASGWSKELAHVRIDLIRYIEKYGDDLMNMPPERRAREWRRRLDRKARDRLVEVCPAVKDWRAGIISVSVPESERS